MTVEAGQWGPTGLIDTAGNALVGISVSILEEAGVVVATIYADRARTPLANPVPINVLPGQAGLDSRGNLLFFAEPGEYWLSYAGLAFPIEVDVPPDEQVGGLPTGAAGGDLAGSTYPNPTIAPGAVTAAKVAADVATQAELDAEATARSGADTAHAAALDPHPGYLTTAEGAAAFDPAGTAAAGDSAHATDAVDSHDASSISLVPPSPYVSTDVQGAIDEIAAQSGAFATFPLDETFPDGSGTFPIITFQSENAAYGPWNLDVSGFPSGTGGRTNDVGTWGYNVNGTKATEPRWYWRLESNYEPGGARWLEAYLEIVPGNGRPGVTTRPFFIVYDELAGETKRWAIASKIGVEFHMENLNVQYGFIGPTSAFFRNASAAGEFAFTLSTPRAQDALTFELLQGGVSALELIAHSDTTPVKTEFLVLGQLVMDLGVDTTTNPDRRAINFYGQTQWDMTNNPQSAIVIVQKATPGQDTTILYSGDGSFAVWDRLSKNGYRITGKVAAPADAELAASQMAYWFDPTNGASKLMVKAKSNNGTVVTGSLALA